MQGKCQRFEWAETSGKNRQFLGRKRAHRWPVGPASTAPGIPTPTGSAGGRRSESTTTWPPPRRSRWELQCGHGGEAVEGMGNSNGAAAQRAAKTVVSLVRRDRLRRRLAGRSDPQQTGPRTPRTTKPFPKCRSH